MTLAWSGGCHCKRGRLYLRAVSLARSLSYESIPNPFLLSPPLSLFISVPRPRRQWIRMTPARLGEFSCLLLSILVQGYIIFNFMPSQPLAHPSGPGRDVRLGTSFCRVNGRGRAACPPLRGMSDGRVTADFRYLLIVIVVHVQGAPEKFVL